MNLFKKSINFKKWFDWKIDHEFEKGSLNKEEEKIKAKKKIGKRKVERKKEGKDWSNHVIFGIGDG